MACVDIDKETEMKNVILALAVLLAGCANTSNPVTIAQATHASYDPYTKQTALSGDLVKQRNYLGLSVLLYRLEADVKIGSEPALRLYVGSNASDTGVLYGASDIDATTLSVVRVNNVSADAAADENVAVTLTRQYLDRHKASGLNIRISGSQKPVIVKVPGAYVEGFLAKLDEVKMQTDKCGGPVQPAAKPGFFTRLFHPKAAGTQSTDADCGR
jgi:hypothetical protein